MIQTLTITLFAIFLLVERSDSHTVKVCTVRNSDNSVTFLAGSYHQTTQGPPPVGGMLVTGPDNKELRYDFTSFVLALSSPAGGPPTSHCGNDGSLCSCSLCPNYPESNIKYYQVVTVDFPGSGTYSITTTSDTVVEQPNCGNFPPVTIKTSFPTNMPSKAPTRMPTNAPTVTTTCTFPKCEDDTVPLDITFMIDESGSINDDQYEIMMNFIKRVLTYDISDESYVSLIRFASIGHYQQYVPFTKLANNGRSSIINSINTHDRVYGLTYIGNAVEQTLSLLDKTNGRKKLLFLITDGDSTDGVCIGDIITTSNIDDNVEIVIIGIGSDASITKFQTEKYQCLWRSAECDIFHVVDFNENDFNDKEYALRQRTCREKESCAGSISSVSSASSWSVNYDDIYENNEERFNFERYEFETKIESLEWTNHLLYYLLAVFVSMLFIALNVNICQYNKAKNQNGIFYNKVRSYPN